MAFGDLLAEFYTNANPPVSQGIITTVVDAGGGLALNEITENNFCLLPNQMPAADHAKIVDGGICHVYIEDDVAAGGSTDICTFIIEKKVVEGSGRNTFLRLSGPDQLREMRERLVNKIISKEETGTAQDTSPTTITLAAGTPDRTGWTVSVPATQPHDQGIVIESHDTGSQVATLAFGWTPTPSSNTTYKLSEGIADPTDLNSIATQLNPFASGIWTLEVEGGNTGTANGSYVVGKGESVLRILQIVQEQSLGEFFRLKSLTPSVRTVEWRRTNASSGITITGDKSLYSNPAYALVVPGTMQAERVDRRFTRIYPYGAGMGPSSLTVISSTINPATLYTGFALINDAAFPGINNTSIETATFHRGAIKTFAEIQAANGTATQQVAAANALMRAAAYWLKQHDGFVWEYRCSVYSHSTLKPGDTIDISWTDPGQNPQTITATGLYIQSAKSRVQKGQKIADLYLTATFLPSNEDTKTVGNHLRTMMGTLRHSEASIGTVSTGGGVIGAHDHAYLPLSGGNLTGNVTLDANVLVDGRDISDDGATLDAVALLAHSPMTVASSTPSGVLAESGQALTFNLTGSNIPTHHIIDKHSYQNGSALDVVGLSAPSTLAMLTPSSNTTAGGAALLKSDSSGNLAVNHLGVNTPAGTSTTLAVTETYTNVAYATGFSTEISHTPTGNFGTGYSGLITGILSIPAGHTASSLETNFTQALFGGGGGTLDSLIGTRSRLGIINANPTGHINSAIAFNIDQMANLASGSPNVTITNAYGLYINNQAGASGTTVTSAYGLYIKDQAGANTSINMLTEGGLTLMNTVGDPSNYFLYYGSGGVPMLFLRDDTVAIGSFSTGTDKLDVAGNIKLNNTLKTGSGTALVLNPGTSVHLYGDSGTPGTGRNIGSNHWVSQSRGWNMTYNGNLDARYVYTDELRAMFFTAAVSQAFNGAIILPKATTEMENSRTTTGDAVQTNIHVKDMPGFTGYPVFSEQDMVRMRYMDTSSGLVFGDVWGRVNSYQDQADGTQIWNFVQTYPAGAPGIGLEIPVGSIVLDYGQPGDGIWEATTLDVGNSPYSQVSTWGSITSGRPDVTVRSRMGSLSGIASATAGDYGIWAGVSPSAPHFIASDSGIEMHGGSISAYEGGDNGVIRLYEARLEIDYTTTGGSSSSTNRSPNGDNDIDALWTNSVSESAYDQINQFASPDWARYVYNKNSQSSYAWLDLESMPANFNNADSVQVALSIIGSGFTNDTCEVFAQIFKSDKATPLSNIAFIGDQTLNITTNWKFSWVDTAASKTDWNGALLLIRWKYQIVSSTETIRLNPSVPSLAIGNPLPTAVDVGDGIWMGRHAATGTYRFRVGHATGPKLLWNASSLALYDSGGNVAIDFAASGNAKIAGILNLGTSGGIYQGTGTFASPSTGLKLWNDAGVGRIAGYNGGTLQAGFDTSGKLTAGGGVVTLDASGVKIQASTAYSDTRAYQLVDTSGNVTGVLGGQVPSPAIASLTRLMTKGISGRSSTLQLYAEALSTNSASVHISAYNGGADAGFLITPTNVLLENGGLTLDTLTSTPTDNEAIYRKGTKLIIKYLDSGTVRYKYFELSGTGVTWTHTTTAP